MADTDTSFFQPSPTTLKTAVIIRQIIGIIYSNQLRLIRTEDRGSVWGQLRSIETDFVVSMTPGEVRGNP